MGVPAAFFLAVIADLQRPPDPEPACEQLLARLHFPLPGRLGRVPLFAPDDVPESLPFTVRIGGRLLRLDVEDVEEYAAGTEVFPLLPGAGDFRDGRWVQEVVLRGLTVRITIEGLVPPERPRPPRASWNEAVGRLSPKLPLPSCDPRLAELGYFPGPHVLLRIDGLFPDDPAGRKAFVEFARERLLPELARTPPPRSPAQPDGPAWSLKTWAHARLKGIDWGESGEVRPDSESPPPDAVGFYHIVEGHEEWQPQRGPAFERLLERFLRGLRWPLPDPPGLQRTMATASKIGWLM